MFVCSRMTCWPPFRPVGSPNPLQQTEAPTALLAVEAVEMAEDVAAVEEGVEDQTTAAIRRKRTVVERVYIARNG